MIFIRKFEYEEVDNIGFKIRYLVKRASIVSVLLWFVLIAISVIDNAVIEGQEWILASIGIYGFVSMTIFETHR